MPSSAVTQAAIGAPAGRGPDPFRGLPNGTLRVLGLALVLAAGKVGDATAFPYLDASNQDQVPQGTELSGTETQDLLQQLQRANGVSAPIGGGWTVLPRIDIQEEITDNVLQANSPRRADLGTFITPGIDVAGSLPRTELTFDYAPTLQIYARTPQLNALTQQFNGVGSVTVVPDFAYVDIRAVSGVTSQYGAFGGVGTLGSSATAPANATLPTINGSATGLNRANEAQTSSFSISPYILDHIRDWGNVKLGYSLAWSNTDTLNSFAAPPFATGGSNGQSLLSNEGYGHFDTGDNLGRLQDSIDIDAQNGQTTTHSGFVDQNGVAAPGSVTTTSNRDTVSNRITYRVDRSFSVFASGGYENITYSDSQARPIHDLTWNLGGIWTPNPDTSLTVSYGHLNGFNSLTVNGYYALTARTRLTVAYGSSLGTQLEAVQNQLGLAAAGSSGGLVNAQTGGPLFTGANALPLANGVFKTTTLALGTNTVYDRDIISLNLFLSTQTNQGGVSSTNSTSKTFSASWLHEMRPDMTLSAAAAYTWQDQGTAYQFNPGSSQSVVASLAYVYYLSATSAASIRYSFLERWSPVTAYNVYQNILILGISKTF